MGEDVATSPGSELPAISEKYLTNTLLMFIADHCELALIMGVFMLNDKSRRGVLCSAWAEVMQHPLYVVGMAICLCITHFHFAKWTPQAMRLTDLQKACDDPGVTWAHLEALCPDVPHRLD